MTSKMNSAYVQNAVSSSPRLVPGQRRKRLVLRLSRRGKFAEAVAVAMEILYMAVDVEYGDWPFAHKLAETIRKLCDEGGLAKESEEHESLWMMIEANQMGGSQERIEAYERWRKSREE